MEPKKQESENLDAERAPKGAEEREAMSEDSPLILASSNPRVVHVTLEAQGTLLYNSEKKFALE